jgi:hypothetical protein
MSRDEGFQVGDRSTRTLYDTRLVRAYRQAGPGVVIAWDAVLDASWAKGERVTLEDAVLPLPYRLALLKVRAALCEAGLLDKDGRIREASWKVWFLPAHDRREARRESGRRGGLAAHSKPSPSEADSEALALLEASSSVALPDRTDRTDRPSVPSDNGSTEAIESSRARPTPVQPFTDWIDADRPRPRAAS